MKKMLMIAAAFAFVAVTQVQAMNLDWNTMLIDDINVGNPMPGYIELVWNGNVISSAVDAGDGSGAVGSVTFYQGAVGAGTYEILGGQELFFRVYNATTPGAATQMITTDMWIMPTFPSANDTTAQSAMNTAWATSLDGGASFIDMANDTRWEAVPEPTSMALLALGVAALGLRRKFRK